MANKKIKRAVALKYDPSKHRAPRITAKGKARLAERIIDLAKEEGIPVTQDPELISVLAELDWYEEIPQPLYQAVAEILAFAYRLNRKANRD
jgi:flagellar biosynthesis protein